MQYRLKLASSLPVGFILAAAALGAPACGHLPFDEIPDFDASGDSFSSSSSSGASGTSGTSGSSGTSGTSGSSGTSGTVTDGGPVKDSTIDPDDGGDGDETIVYVSSKTGKKDAPGTRSEPVADTTQAVALLVGTRSRLWLAAGEYSPISLAAAKGELTEIKGGFHCDVGDCTWADAAEPTGVEAQNILDGAFTLDDGSGPLTITNVRFKGANGGTGTTALVGVTLAILRRTVTLENVAIDGPTVSGSATKARSIALLVRGAKTKVSATNCKITGGKSIDIGAGIVVEDGPVAISAGERPVLDLSGSTVSGGTAKSSYAVLLTSAGTGTRIQGNELFANASSTGEGESWAISADGNIPEVDITKNRINRLTTNGPYCTEQVYCGGIHARDAKVTIQNNAIRGLPASWSAAVFLETTLKTQPAMIVNGNVLDGANAAGGSDNRSVALAIRNTYTATAKFGSVRNNIMLGGQANASYGVHESEGTTNEAHLAAFSNNAIMAGVTYHAAFPPGAPKDLKGTANLKTIPVDGIDVTNLYEKPCPLTDGVHLDPAATNSCVGNGTSKEAPKDDYDGQLRANPTDIGADQQ